eukprot:jgi/Galph1/848/GphlegSOOS_G5692.1
MLRHATYHCRVGTSLVKRWLSMQSNSSIVNDTLEETIKKRPHKTALKFLETTREETVFFTFSEVYKHSTSFARGLLELGYGPGTSLACCLPIGSPEYLFAFLGSLQSGTCFISIDNSVDAKQVDIVSIHKALEKFAPKGFLMWHEYKPNHHQAADSVSNVIPHIWTELFPELQEFHKGLQGFTRYSGRPFSSNQFPTLRHVFHTGNANLPGLLRYKNIFVYDTEKMSLNGFPERLLSTKGDMASFISTAEEKVYLEKDIMQLVQRCEQSLPSHADHNQREGRIIVPPHSKATMLYLALMIACLRKQCLGIIPCFHDEQSVINSAIEKEDAMFVQLHVYKTFSTRIQKYHVYVVAGEVSGDRIGSYLIHSLRKRDTNLCLSGVGGSLLERQGLKSLFPYNELSIMGWQSVLPRLFQLQWRLLQVERDIYSKQPHVVIAIDNKGFSFRLFQRLGKYYRERNDYKRPLFIQYVAPSVWAVHNGLYKAEQFGKLIDHVFLLFPLESPYWKQVGVPFTVVGPPAWERKLLYDRNPMKKQSISQKSNQKRILVLLGSRLQEVKRVASLVLHCLIQVARENKEMNIQLIIPYVRHTLVYIQSLVESMRSSIPSSMMINWMDGEQDDASYGEALASSHFAIGVSGTAILECHFFQLPVICIYSTDWLSYWLIKRQVTIKYACIVNIMMNQAVIPELLFKQCTEEHLLPMIR